MKAARYYGPHDIRIEDIPEPGPPGTGEVVIRVELAALCGTDVSQYHAPTMIPVSQPHRVSGQIAPITLGHEMVGTIVAVGPGVTGLAVGQRVVPGSGYSCGACPQCLVGRSNICQYAYLYGIHADGGLAEFVRVPDNMCVPVPEGCSLEAAAMAQPLAVALHALDRVDIVPGNRVAIFGVGGIGSLLLAAQHVFWEPRRRPSAMIAVDIDAARLQVAASLGIHLRVNAQDCDAVQALREMTAGGGLDVAIEASGSPTSIVQALTALKRGGRLLQVGIPISPVSLPLGDLVVSEKEILTSNGQICQEDLPRALALLATTRLAERIGYQLIDLVDLVEQGLVPLAEHRASAKILVRIP